MQFFVANVVVAGRNKKEDVNFRQSTSSHNWPERDYFFNSATKFAIASNSSAGMVSFSA